jgi:hypothetical protein
MIRGRSSAVRAASGTITDVSVVDAGVSGAGSGTMGSGFIPLT